ncbi:Propionate catabolism operon transcriptional regulator of GntR family [Rhodovulum sp. PH10]|uniref:GntR family transcriptional regulator n=1 Tax=Rhodovulum sp. PH10 TaxID=1187851 RepID=UPI00027C2091|nr:GntR family transcriptional regulator [Rhodovulum sp. PH10]EJW10346.1 Propionate catabolism operon transcriptional regulator of GntR family [Rhodovulum sp. PH10]
MGDSELDFEVPTLVSLSRQIEQHLEGLIVKGALKSGQRLSEPEIAKLFRTSRSPVREALRRLEQLGLVVIEPRRGATVKAPSDRDVEDLLACREALEGMAARLAAVRAGPAEIAMLRGCIEVQLGQAPEATELIDFHEALIRASGNSALENMLRGTWNLFRMVRLIPDEIERRKALAIDEHRTIFGCIEARDADGAEAAARRHIRTMGSQLIGREEAPPAPDAPPFGGAMLARPRGRGQRGAA